VVLLDRSRLGTGLKWIDDLIGRSECAFLDSWFSRSSEGEDASDDLSEIEIKTTIL
jgi:hypothetical protein